MTVEILQRELVNDLLAVHERFADEKFCGELYRALTATAMRKPGAADGHLTLSYTQAEGLVNDLRHRLGADPLTLAQTGGEGEVDSTITDELGGRGWAFDPATSGADDPSHGAGDESPPPGGSPHHPDSGRWSDLAHAEADQERRRKTP